MRIALECKGGGTKTTATWGVCVTTTLGAAAGVDEENSDDARCRKRETRADSTMIQREGRHTLNGSQVMSGFARGCTTPEGVTSTMHLNTADSGPGRRCDAKKRNARVAGGGGGCLCEWSGL